MYTDVKGTLLSCILVCDFNGSAEGEEINFKPGQQIKLMDHIVVLVRTTGNKMILSVLV